MTRIDVGCYVTLLLKRRWSYISIGYFKQRTVAAGETGSSTMRHKVLLATLHYKTYAIAVLSRADVVVLKASE